MYASAMPDAWEAVSDTVIVFVFVVPRTMSAPPFTVTLLTVGSSAASSAALTANRLVGAEKRSAALGLSRSAVAWPAWAAGTARAARARAPVTAATVERMRIYSSWMRGGRYVVHDGDDPEDQSSQLTRQNRPATCSKGCSMCESFSDA